MSRNRFIIRGKVFLIILGVSIGLLLAEGVARFVASRSQSVVIFKGDMVGEGGDFIFSPDAVLLYEWKKLPQPPPSQKAADEFRIIVLGDSLTYRRMWTIDAYYPAHLEKLLHSRFRGRHFAVYNCGVPGYNTVQEVRLLEKYFIDTKPDMVIVGYSAPNDSAVKRRLIRYSDGWYCSDIQENYPYLLKLPWGLNDFLLERSVLFRMLNTFFSQKAFAWGLAANVNYVSLSERTEEALMRIKHLSDMYGFRLLFVIFPPLSDIAFVPHWIRGRLAQFEIDYIDLRERFQKEGYQNLFISNRDYHPNQKGHIAAAEEIAEYFTDNDFRKYEQ